MPLDRNSFRYKFEKAYARGWPLPEPKNKTQEKIRDDIIEVKEAIKLKKQQEFDIIMRKSPLTFDVIWHTADLIQAEGTISAELPELSGMSGIPGQSKDFGEVRLTRTRGTPLLTFIGMEELSEFPIILNSRAQILGYPWKLPNKQLSGHTIYRYVPGMEWGKDEHTIRIIQVHVPTPIADEIFDALGIESEAIINGWYRLSPSEQTSARRLWKEEWHKRWTNYYRPKPPKQTDSKPKPEPEPLKKKSGIVIELSEWKGTGKFRKAILRDVPNWIERVVLRLFEDGSSQLRVFGHSNGSFSAEVKNEFFTKNITFTPKLFSSFRGHYSNLDYKTTQQLLRIL